jgi:hypothetical protein
VARMNYGKAVERLVAERINQSPALRRVFARAGGAGQPDFVGRGPIKGVNFDVTTQAAIAEHLTRPYGPGLQVATYARPYAFRVFP